MAALQELLDEQARIKQEMQRMEDDDSVTEETDGDLRDTLLARWEELDAKSKPLIARMEKIRQITRIKDEPGNAEAGADTGNGNGRVTRNSPYGSPDLVIRNNRDPYDSLEAVKGGLIRRSEVRARALDAIELEEKRGNLMHDFAEETTRKAQDQFYGKSNIARHILLTGSQEYQDAFSAYLEDPQGNVQRAMSLTQANGGYLLPFVLDYQVA